MTSFSSTQLTELSWLNISSGFFQKHNFSERWRTELLLRDVSRNFFHPCRASPPPIQPSLLVSWLFYNSQNLQTQQVSQTVWKKNRKLLVTFLSSLSSPMTRPYACLSPRWNLSSAGKDELTGAALIKDNGTPIPTPVESRTPTLTPTTTAAAAASLDNKLFKQFMKTYLEVQVPVRTEVDPESCKQSLKAWFPNLYYGNLHIDCYQFWQ